VPLKKGDLTHMGSRILAVDDDHDIRRLLRLYLTAQHYDVHEAGTGLDAIEKTRAARPDAIILDLGLPDLDGVAVTRAIREWSQIPILVLSVRAREVDKIDALDAGADDYLSKPFAPGELMARIRALLRRVAPPGDGGRVEAGEIAIDFARHSVTLRGAPVQLTPTEYDLLKMLIRDAGKVLTHRHIIHELWGSGDYEDEAHLLRVNVSNLRRKLEPDPTRPRYLITEPGVGYRLRAGDEPSPPSSS
jgi:two-component system KDP operon response regulator KdpE